METLPTKKREEFLYTPRYIVEQSMKLPKLGEMDLAEKQTGLLNAIIAGYAKMGHTGDHSVTQAAIVNDIISNPMLNKLSILDIETAITRGIRGKYGIEFVMLNVPVVNAFIGGWLGERVTIYNEIASEQKPQLQQENPIAINIKQKEAYENLVSYINEHKVVPKVWPFSPAFIHMESVGEINLSHQEKEALKSRVITELTNEANRLKGDSGKYRDAITNINDPETIKFECRRRAVIDWCELYIKTLTL